MRTNIKLFDFTITNCGIEQDVAYAYELVHSNNKGSYFACANPHSLVVAARDPLFRDALKGATILVPDGAGIILAAKILKLPLYDRVAGYEFFKVFSDFSGKKEGMGYYFLGSSNDVLNLMTARLNKEYPLIKVCGTFSPPYSDTFSDSDNARMINMINQASPDVLWVGMSAPKQEKWIYQNKDKLNVPFIGAIGAVFDFYAGTKKRSSSFWQRLGLEWLPRFVNEPRRLWERNMKSTPIFLSWVLREKIKQLSKR